MSQEVPTVADATLTVDDVKMLRETLSLAQSALGVWGRMGMDRDRVPRHIERLGGLIAQLDAHRPLGRDSKHDDRHTPTCGCDLEPGDPTPGGTP